MRFSLRRVYASVQDIFTALRFEDMAELEKQVLYLIDWRIPMDGRAANAYVQEMFAAANQWSGTVLQTPDLCVLN